MLKTEIKLYIMDKGYDVKLWKIRRELKRQKAFIYREAVDNDGLHTIYARGK
jgi:hypothetical protein